MIYAQPPWPMRHYDAHDWTEALGLTGLEYHQGRFLRGPDAGPTIFGSGVMLTAAIPLCEDSPENRRRITEAGGTVRPAFAGHSRAFA